MHERHSPSRNTARAAIQPELQYSPSRNTARASSVEGAPSVREFHGKQRVYQYSLFAHCQTPSTPDPRFQHQSLSPPSVGRDVEGLHGMSKSQLLSYPKIVLS